MNNIQRHAEDIKEIKNYAALLERGQWYLIHELREACCADMPWISPHGFTGYLIKSLNELGVGWRIARRRVFNTMGKQEKCIFLLK